MSTILVIDDEAGIRFTIREVLQGPDLRVLAAENAEQGLQLTRDEAPDLVLLDIRLGNRSGLDLFHELRAIDPKLLVVFITGHGTAETAIEAMKLGAFDYLVKPLDLAELHHIVEQALKISHLIHVPAAVDSATQLSDASDRLIGSGPAMQSLFKQMGRVAPLDVNVLILGESGTGKELVARAIYHHSRRSQGPFLAINCAAIPETLLESELFGHEKGAFTGADRQRIGKFEQCHRGTILLDEVGDMPLATQAKMLRLLQDGQFQRVGGNETLTVDVRVLAATNQNLDAMIAENRFRRDLYYRIRGVTLHLPPLREREDDVAELAHYFLFRLNRQLGTAVQTISREALEMLEQHPWPGNVRELQSVLREALIVATGPTLLPEFLALSTPLLPSEIERPEPVALPRVGDWNKLEQYLEEGIKDRHPDLYRGLIQRFDAIVLGQVMQAVGGLQSRAAEALGLSRPTLRAKLRLISRGLSGNSSEGDAAKLS
ncbi:MAG TPA: sigma-54 dependent transcriptional regulator [Pirellulaceae bacterium]|jgi:two-component system nitrogen regulation response regulator GlnG